jgi:signal peptidase I
MNPTTENPVSPRKVWAAVALSLLFPGLGHIYAGKFVKGLILAFLCATPFFFMISILALRLSWVNTFLFVLLYLGGSLLMLYVVIDSALLAKKAPPDYRLKEYNRWYVYLLLVLLGTGSGAQYGIQTFCTSFATFHVPNASMYPTFRNHDRFIANSTAYKVSDPQRGDVVVFSSPDNKNITFVRRVVALAGDTVEIENGRILLNGQLLPREKVSSAAGDSPGDIFTEINGPARYKIFLAPRPAGATDLSKFTVPKHHCFVLADNRNQAFDSRAYGPIPYAAIKGRADYLYFTLHDWSRLGNL